MKTNHDPSLDAVFRTASLLSIFAFLMFLSLHISMTQDLQKFHLSIEKSMIEMQEDHLLMQEAVRVRRQAFYPRSHSSSHSRRNAYICGERGPPGPPGDRAYNGYPGRPGVPGTSGVDLAGEIVCPPCPQGRRGPDGQPGEKGEPGRPGKPGIPGIDGHCTPGLQGETGNRGPDGYPGQKGSKGEPGQDAVQLIGVPGPIGPPGAPGLHGPRGDPGENGLPAPPGPEGPPGIEGEAGEPGIDGLRGPPGRRGAPGEDGGYCKCPNRDGEEIGGASLPITWDEYRHGKIRTVAVPEYKAPPPEAENYREVPEYRPEQEEPVYKPRSETAYKRPPTPESAYKTRSYESEYDNYARKPAARSSTIRHSPNQPLIEYRDSREQGVSNKVVLRRGETSSIDFDLRK